MSEKTDQIFDRVTNDLIDALEAGASGADWEPPWQRFSTIGAPVSADGRAYRGFNFWVLISEALDKGYASNTWGTYKTWKKHDVQVRRGEKGTQVVLWKPYERKNADGEPERGLFARAYTVFAAEQCDGAEKWTDKPAVEWDTPERIAEADAFFTAVGADVRHGGDQAYYTPAADRIQLPNFEQFRSAADYYSTAAHEHTHWTGHESRLDRDKAFGNKFGDERYAAEELVAELGAAYWSSLHGVTQTVREDHAQYLAHWIKVLKETPKALLTVTAKAQAAIDFLEKAAVGEPEPERELEEVSA